MKKTTNKTFIFIIALNLFLIIFNYLLIFIGKRYGALIEKYYSRNIFYTINKPLTYFSNKFNFSIGEILLFILGTIIIILLLKSLYSLFLQRYPKALLNLLLILFLLLSLLTYYQLVWGLNNYRISIEDNFNFDGKDINIDDLADSYKYLILKSNDLKKDLLKTPNNHISKEYIYTNVYKGFENLNYQYPFISDTMTIVKPLMISQIFSTSGYTGIYLPFLSEANVNYMIPEFSLPFTASHEISHQKGFASEDSANFIGFLACYYHDDNFFKYSGFQAMMTYVGNSLYNIDKELYHEISSLKSDELLEDIDIKRAFWDKHVSKKSKEIHNKINDSFLKANNQSQGIVTYSKVSQLFVKAYKSGLIN